MSAVTVSNDLTGWSLVKDLILRGDIFSLLNGVCDLFHILLTVCGNQIKQDVGNLASRDMHQSVTSHRRQWVLTISSLLFSSQK